MDAPDLDPEVHQRALIGLSRLNRLSGVSGALFRKIARHASTTSDRPYRVLDVASGSGDLPIAWLRIADAKRIPLEVTALDRSELAMQQAAQSARRHGVRLNTITRDCIRDGLPEPLSEAYDLVTCSLFMHHLEDDQSSALVQEMVRVGGGRILVCDLDRSRFHLALVALTSRIVTRSPVVHFDAVASMRGAYTRHEFADLISRIVSVPFEVRRLFPCRFVVTTLSPGPMP